MNPLKKPLPAYILIITAAMILIAVACNKGISTNNPTTGNPNNIPADQTVTASVQGRVVDQNGVPVQGAAVKSGTATTTTDINGVFSFSAISMSSRFGYVQVVKSGYFTGSRSIITNPGASNFVTIQLTPRTETGSFSGATGGSIVIQTGDSATFSDSSIVNASTNTLYTGTVHVFTTYLDPTDPNLYKYMPGDLRGIGSNGFETALQSFGMVLVELQDDAGNKLQIAGNHTATLTWAIPASLQAAAPPNIPLWYFNDTTGRWIEQGSAARSGNSYTGKVAHFSFWNCDQAASTVNYKIHVKDQFGNPVAFAAIQFLSSGWGDRVGYTDSTGFAQGLIPKGQSLVMQVVTECGTVLGGINVGPAIQDQDLGTVTITVQQSELTLTGTVVDCSNNPVDSGYVNINVDGLDYRAIVIKGSFTLPVSRCYSTTVPISATAFDLLAQQGGATTTVSGSTGNLDVGQLSACGNPLAQFINITVNGSSYNWTVPPDNITNTISSGNAYDNGVDYPFSFTDINGVSADKTQTIDLSTGTLDGYGNQGVISAVYPYKAYLGVSTPHTNFGGGGSAVMNVTSVGDVGGFIVGTITCNLKDTLSGISYPVTGNFKVLRTQ